VLESLTFWANHDGWNLRATHGVYTRQNGPGAIALAIRAAPPL
jgi:hypothetical protein